MFFITFLLLFVLWILFSGRFDAFHLVLGIISSLIVTYYCQGLIFRDKKRKFSARLQEIIRFPIYLAWLVWEIIIANFYILYIVLHPKMMEMISPELVELDIDDLENDFARVVYANSITLTPGTISIHLKGKGLVVYAINGMPLKSLDQMKKKVAWVFNTKQHRKEAAHA